MSILKSDWNIIIEQSKKKYPAKYKRLCSKLSDLKTSFDDIYELIKSPLRFDELNEMIVQYHKGLFVNKNSLFGKYVKAVRLINSKDAPFSEELKTKLWKEFYRVLPDEQKSHVLSELL